MASTNIINGKGVLVSQPIGFNQSAILFCV